MCLVNCLPGVPEIISDDGENHSDGGNENARRSAARLIHNSANTPVWVSKVGKTGVGFVLERQSRVLLLIVITSVLVAVQRVFI